MGGKGGTGEARTPNELFFRKHRTRLVPLRANVNMFFVIALLFFVPELGAFIVVVVRAAVVALSAHAPRCCSFIVFKNAHSLGKCHVPHM